MAPQILPGTPFGDALTNLAREAEMIVEIGSGGGHGSTQCLLRGMELAGQRLTCVEPVHYDELRDNMRGEALDKCSVLGGVISRMIKPLWHPDPAIQSQVAEMWIEERRVTTRCNVIVSLLPRHIDLLLLDGGEFTSDGDFLTLWTRATVIALDDINPQKAVKNCYAHTQLDQAGWELAASDLHDRNGWSIWRRP